MSEITEPIPMILFCPRCGRQHIDRPDPSIGWSNPPHRSHLCHTAGCNTVWRPADVHTVGVLNITTGGNADTWSPPAADEPESNLVKYAEAELRFAGMFDADADYGGDVAHEVVNLIRAFSRQGHSGGSAGLVISLFARLASFRPLGPLTGMDDEWVEVGPSIWQNRRCSSVFRDDARFAYDIDAVVYEEPNGNRFTRGGERHPITFPYTPGNPRIIKVDYDGCVI